MLHLHSLFSHPTVKPSNVVIDAVSMSLMKGSVIDFATELIGSSFRIVENPQVSPFLEMHMVVCSWCDSPRAVVVDVASAGNSRKYSFSSPCTYDRSGREITYIYIYI